MPPDMHGFDEPSARRIVRSTRHVEAHMRQSRPRPPRAPVLHLPVVVAKITSGSNPYSAVEVYPDASGAWVVRSDGITFAAAGPNKLYERNDNANVPANTYVRAWPAYFNGSTTWEWVFDYPSALPQSGSGVPSHTAPAGSIYYSTTYFTLYVNYNGSTGWSNAYGTAYDYLGRLVYTRQALTTGSTLTANHRVQHTLVGTGYTTVLPAVAGLDTEHYAFYVLPSATGIYTLDGNSNEELQGPRGSGAAVNRTRKYVKNEHVFIEGDGSNWRILAETMLEVGFSATVSGTQTGVATATATKVTFGTENWDINDNFASSKHTPLAPGIYNYGATVGVDSLADGAYAKLMLYKNGSLHRVLAQVNNGAAATVILSGATEVSMNGSTDYVEVYIEHSHGGDRDLLAATDSMHFYGSRIRRDES